MSRVAVIQARMGSTRLPGKVLKPLGGRSVLQHVIARVSQSSCVDEIVLATTVLADDDPLALLGEGLGVRVVRGATDDLLSRYTEAARLTRADTILRITADCPCVDADVIDRVTQAHLQSRADYTSNVRPRTFPHGLDVEIMAAKALAAAERGAQTSAEREHVTPFIWRRPERFALHNVEARPSERRQHLRVTLDTQEDYIMLQGLYDLIGRDDFSLPDLLKVVDRHPWLAEINRNVRQKEVL